MAAALEHHRAGRLYEAEASYRQLLSERPSYAPALQLRGIVAHQLGRSELAVTLLRQCLHQSPHNPVYSFNLASALSLQGKLEEAVAAYRQAIIIQPDYALAYFNLGVLVAGRGKLEEAIAAYRRAIRVKPDYAVAYFNLGVALSRQDNIEVAVDAYRQAIRIKPDYAGAHSNLGNALRQQGKLGEAIAAHRRAIGINSKLAGAHVNLGNALSNQGKVEEAITAYRHAISIKPDFAEAHRNLIFCLNYLDKITPGELFAAHRLWQEQFGRPVLLPKAYANPREVGRRLKIGYVSPDFREHSVAYFLEPLLAGHDSRTVDVFCYAEVARPDAITARFKGYAAHWLVTIGQSDGELAERIRADGIDILVDLAGHTANNRLGVFARKPAPIQVTWLGYPNTTGLKTIDYRLVDAVTDPMGEADGWASETLVRLEGGFLCYGAINSVPEPIISKELTDDSVTFGSFNNPVKLSPSTLDLWAKLMARLPRARLLLKGKPFTDVATRALFLSRMRERGVRSERVDIVSWLPAKEAHLELYNRVDIALDPFPYNGTTTTCEALWMGVPVVTLRGDRHSSRVGASLLTQVDMTGWISDSTDEYLEIAIALAANRQRLNELRRSLRHHLAASPLCDHSSFARKIEAAYRAMWRHWCQGRPASAI